MYLCCACYVWKIFFILQYHLKLQYMLLAMGFMRCFASSSVGNYLDPISDVTPSGNKKMQKVYKGRCLSTYFSTAFVTTWMCFSLYNEPKSEHFKGCSIQVDSSVQICVQKSQLILASVLPRRVKFQNRCSFCPCRLLFPLSDTLGTFSFSNASLVVYSLTFPTLKFSEAEMYQINSQPMNY